VGVKGTHHSGEELWGREEGGMGRGSILLSAAEKKTRRRTNLTLSDG